MKLQNLSLTAYDVPFTFGGVRSGFFLHLTDESGKVFSGEIAPLPSRSKETLGQALQQFYQKRKEILSIDWQESTCLSFIGKLQLFPSVSFALESALLDILSPLPPFSPPVSALLMGSVEEILQHAEARKNEGYKSAKLKVGRLSFNDAKIVIDAFKDTFLLRIDVNRAWETKECLEFFSQYPLDAFEYVEEPFKEIADLPLFTHPLAIDESFPQDLCLEELEALPMLKAVIYKPMIQGGMAYCLPLQAWANVKKISFILSSGFETELGLSSILAMWQRLSLTTSVGIGTHHYFSNAGSFGFRRLENISYTQSGT